MDTTAIIREIDTQIATLNKVKALLNDAKAIATPGKKKVGRPKGSGKKSAPVFLKKRTMSPEARKKIGDAQKKRWADQNKQKKTA